MRASNLGNLARVESELTEREQEVVQLVGRLSVMSGSQLRRVCFPLEKTGRGDGQVPRRVLLRLTRRGVLARLQRRIGGIKGGSEGFTYRLGPVGQRLAVAWAGGAAARARRPAEPGERFLAHRLAVSELYVQLREAETAGGLRLVAFEPEPACWRPFNAPLRGSVTLKPDAFIRLVVGELELHWFVEMDRGTVSQATRARQAAAYREYWRSRGPDELIPRVLWAVPTEVMAARVAESIRPDDEPAGLFVITTAASAVAAAVDPGDPS